MKGRKCKCGFVTLAGRPRCPRCGKITSDAEWADFGKVLSSARLNAAPEGFKAPMSLLLIEVEGKGPKLACWSEEEFAVGDRVALVDMGGNAFTCDRAAPEEKRVRRRSSKRR